MYNSVDLPCEFCSVHKISGCVKVYGQVSSNHHEEELTVSSVARRFESLYPGLAPSGILVYVAQYFANTLQKEHSPNSNFFSSLSSNSDSQSWVSEFIEVSDTTPVLDDLSLEAERLEATGTLRQALPKKH